MSVTFVEPDFSKYPQHKNSKPVGDVPPELPVPDVDLANDDSLSLSPRPTTTRRKSSSSVHTIDGVTSPYRRRVSFDTISSVDGPPAAFGSGGKRRTSSNNSSTTSGSLFPTFMIPYYSQASKEKDREYSSYFVSSCHFDHKYSHDSRSLLFSFSPKAYSIVALKWIVANMLQDGDELICLRMHSSAPDSKAQSYQPEAQRILDQVVKVANDCGVKINVVVELGVGKIKTAVYKTLALYQPSLVFVAAGQNSFGNFKRMRYKKSITSYLVARSPVPVIIVSPHMGVVSAFEETDPGSGVRTGRSKRQNSASSLPAAGPAAAAAAGAGAGVGSANGSELARAPSLSTDSTASISPGPESNAYFSGLLADIADETDGTDTKSLRPVLTNNTTSGVSEDALTSDDDDDDDDDDDEDFDEDDPYADDTDSDSEPEQTVPSEKGIMRRWKNMLKPSKKSKR